MKFLIAPAEQSHQILILMPIHCALRAWEHWCTVACALQNPHAVKVKEEASRLRKRLAAAKKDAAEQEAKAKEQADLLAKLQANLDNITAGAVPL